MGTKESSFTHLADSFFSMLSGDTSKSSARRTTEGDEIFSGSVSVFVSVLASVPSELVSSFMSEDLFAAVSSFTGVSSFPAGSSSVTVSSPNISSDSSFFSIFPGTSPTEEPTPFPASILPLRSTISPRAASSRVTLTLSVAVSSGKIRLSSQTSR